jgi:hypothetical protein
VKKALMPRFVTVFALVALASAPLLSDSALADGGANHQDRNTHFGVSGGNVNDISRRYCCSGTLGALVKDQNNTLYILSNNHVLNISGTGTPGDDVSQPGLIDNNCRIATVVADLTGAAPLGSNVDAAIAQLRPGTMDSSGYIEDIGVPSSNIRSATVGLGVAKSGRTTGFTTGSISSVSTSVTIRYQPECGRNGGTRVNYTNQVVINSSTFSAGGDSGSLIVTNNACHQPVALLYAGSSTSTIGNPIGEVLTKVGSATGRTLSFVGTTCTAAKPDLGTVSEEKISAAIDVKNRYVDALMSTDSVIGVGVGESKSHPGEAAIVVYVDRTTGAKPQLPKRLDGMRVRVVRTDPFVLR